MRRFIVLVGVLALVGSCRGPEVDRSILQVSETVIGEVVADGAGFTLYMFTFDEGGVPICSDACIDRWPPITGGITLGPGLDETLLDFAARPDGTLQARFGGLPLYRFLGDERPGDVNGHGVNGFWFAVGVDGEPVDG